MKPPHNTWQPQLPPLLAHMTGTTRTTIMIEQHTGLGDDPVAPGHCHEMNTTQVTPYSQLHDTTHKGSPTVPGSTLSGTPRLTYSAC